VSIVSANLLVSHYGKIAVIPVAFLLIGLDLTLRDTLHDKWHNNIVRNMGLLILVGSIITYLINASAVKIAIASFAAFGSATITDSIVYHFFRKRSFLVRSNASNLAGAIVDSFMFVTIAFGFSPIVSLLQFIAKAIGGAIWSWLMDRLEWLSC